MALLLRRAVAPLQPGDNATDVLINDVHFDRAALARYNYTLYSNGTLSNGSACYLAFQGFQPHLFAENGTVVNGTSCYAPIHDIGQHASLGLAFALVFAISIFFSLVNLRKHGRRYLPPPRQHAWSSNGGNGPLGRRWKWYWMIVVGVCGTISCFMTVDVDRGYLQGTPLILQSVFYTLMMPALMAAVWEGVRHWATWQTRQIRDRDPFAFTIPNNKKASRQETFLPFLFYALTIATTVLTIPRSWSAIQYQRSPEQALLLAAPVATDTRFRAAGFTALAAMVVVTYSLEHSIYRYKAGSGGGSGRGGIQQQIKFYVTAAPSQFLVVIVLLGLKVGYSIAGAFEWSVSPFRYDVSGGWLFGLGYVPAVLVLGVFNVVGLCELNEDRALIVLREERDSGGAGGGGDRKMSWRKKVRGFVGRDGEVDIADLGRVVELGVLGEDEKDKDAARVTTTRKASQTSSASGSGSGSPERIEYVIPQRNA